MRERLTGDGDAQLLTVREIDRGLAPCSKNTVFSGPWTARQSRRRRCNVRTCPASNWPGCFSWSSSISVLASSTPLVSATSSGTSSDSHTSVNASGRVRQARAFLVSDGSGPAFHFRALRTDMSAVAAAVSCVFSIMSFCLNKLT